MGRSAVEGGLQGEAVEAPVSDMDVALWPDDDCCHNNDRPDDEL